MYKARIHCMIDDVHREHALTEFVASLAAYRLSFKLEFHGNGAELEVKADEKQHGTLKAVLRGFGGGAVITKT